ncbi:TolC family outer membrane protein [Vibrio sp. CAU 1672]|uniref:TolC family outer membrane protein n=1 Tax=Vibrio sp. CAU 1672 TaxID=3032594 RepID=UPI0023DB7603|nr:TolC family outer membrane protein [Vibrio sp. CAU 1672]MDF2154600.1 TolC family outer membrane protein [Vibrio sp. CAU 1672]
MNRKSLVTIGIGLALAGQSAHAESINLSQLYLDSLDNNPTLASAALEIESANKQRGVIKGQYRPQVDLGLQYGMLRNDWTTMNETDAHGAEVSVSVGQNLYNQQLNATDNIAKHQQALTEVSYQYALNSLQMSVAQGYFNALKAQEKRKQVRATKHAIGEHLTQMQHRFANGLVPENDVKEAQAQYDLAKTAVIFAENEVEKALDYLYELTGQTYSSVTPLSAKLPSISIPQPKGQISWEEQAQLHSPQMQIQRQLVTLSREQVALAEAGHMPTLGLVAEYRYAFAGQSRSNGMNDPKGSFNDIDDNATLFAGVAMKLPAYRGGATSNKVEQANIQYQQSVQLQHHTWRQVVRGIRSAEKDLLALKSAQSAYQQAVISAESALLATEQGLEIGSRTIVDVLNSTRQLYEARQQLTESQIDFLVANLQLHFLVGALDDDDLTAVNTLLTS